MILLSGVLYARWAAGITDSFFAGFVSESAALVATGLMAIYLLASGRIPKVAWMFAAGLLAWILAAAASYVANPDAIQREAVALLALITFYLMFGCLSFISLKTEENLISIARFLKAFLIVGSLLSFHQIASGAGFIENGAHQRPRAFGSDVHPVSFGIQIVVALVGLSMIRSKLGWRASTADRIVTVLALVALYLTFARTAWVMGLFVVFFTMTVSHRSLLRTTLGAALVVLSFLFLLTTDRFADLSSLPTFFENFSFRDSFFDFRYVDNSISWRIVNWSYGLTQAMENPFFGHGPGQSAIASYFSLEMHNMFLEVLFEGGIFNLTALGLTLWGLFCIHKSLPHRTKGEAQSRRLANALGIALLLAITFSTSLVDQLMTVVLYLLVLAAARARKQPSARAKQTLTGFGRNKHCAFRAYP